MTRVGICGLGAMGRRMARRLVDAGYEVVAWNRSAVTLPDLQMRATPADVAAEATVVITMLADPAALRVVVAGERGLAAGLRPGATLVEMSTVGPTVVHEIRAVLGPNVELLDAPVIGSLSQAEAGELRILVGGERASYDRVATVLHVLGEPSHVGALGSGAAQKLIANAATASLPALLSDALAIAHRLGVSTPAALDVLEATGMRAFVERVRGAVESGEHPAGFRLALARKDLDLALSETEGLAPTIVQAAAERLRRAESEGQGNAGFTAIVGDLERAR